VVEVLVCVEHVTGLVLGEELGKELGDRLVECLGNPFARVEIGIIKDGQQLLHGGGQALLQPRPDDKLVGPFEQEDERDMKLQVDARPPGLVPIRHAVTLVQPVKVELKDNVYERGRRGDDPDEMDAPRAEGIILGERVLNEEGHVLGQ